jgi:hypothetical protein
MATVEANVRKAKSRKNRHTVQPFLDTHLKSHESHDLSTDVAGDSAVDSADSSAIESSAIDSSPIESSAVASERGNTADVPIAAAPKFKIGWPSVIWLVVLHLGALAAPFFFSWQGLALAVFLHWVTGSIGICLGYHRLFTHTGFKTSQPMRGLIAWIGTMAGQGTPIEWVADHRKHHAHSDQEGDPHSPHDGSWWSHMLWLSAGKTPETMEAHIKRPTFRKSR